MSQPNRWRYAEKSCEECTVRLDGSWSKGIGVLALDLRGPVLGGTFGLRDSVSEATGRIE